MDKTTANSAPKLDLQLLPSCNESTGKQDLPQNDPWPSLSLLSSMQKVFLSDERATPSALCENVLIRTFIHTFQELLA